MLKIDGYTPPDAATATETGIECKYTTNYGEFVFQTKSSGSVNTDFQKAAEKLASRRAIQAKTGYKPSTTESLQDTLAVWHDHVIISWSTTVTAEGKPIAPTKENFVELFSMEMFLGVFSQLAADAADLSLFAKEVEAEAAKN